MASNQSSEFKAILRQYRIDMITDKNCESYKIINWISEILKSSELQLGMLNTMNCIYTIDQSINNWIFYTDYLGGGIYWNGKYKKELLHLITNSKENYPGFEDKLYAAFIVSVDLMNDSIKKDFLNEIIQYTEYLFMSNIPYNKKT